MGRLRRGVGKHPWLVGASIALLSAVASVWDTDLHAPPRFDGAGYAVLAESLGTGRGYREIDRPDSPRHAHFPPGYPASLAAVWLMTGRSAPAAHLLSIACTVAATVASWLWFRRMEGPFVAALLGISLAVNWTWARTAGAIQSEPLYLLLGQLALLIATRAGRRGGGNAVGLGLGALLGACILTRQVGGALAAAVGLDLMLRRRVSTALAAAVTALVFVLPWVAWLLTVREHTQAELFTREGSPGTILSQAVFYLQRVPDQLTGPVVEVGTVFARDPRVSLVVNAWAVVATGLLLFGWARTMHSPRRRLAGLVAFFTLSLLLVWPFTEAGRFLIPLVPCVLIGAVEGLTPVIRKARRPRVVAAILILTVSLPYSAYAITSGRSAAQRRTHTDFDAACAWIARYPEAPGPVLTRHPGEVYWQTGRQALPPADDLAEIGRVVARDKVAYLLIDEERYVNAPANPLAMYAGQNPGSVRPVWSRESGKSMVRVYEVVREIPRWGEVSEEAPRR